MVDKIRGIVSIGCHHVNYFKISYNDLVIITCINLVLDGLIPRYLTPGQISSAKEHFKTVFEKFAS